MTTTTPTEAVPASLADFLREARRRVDRALADQLAGPEPDPSGPGPAEGPGGLHARAVGGVGKIGARGGIEAKGCPPDLLAAMRHSLLAGGKRLRPVFALLAAEACGADPWAAMPAACALEMVHTYSLIHDDLPCMDDDDLRRGRPTCHKAFGEATALLAGDTLLTMAFEVLARDLSDPSVAAGCVLELARGAGAEGMAGGQMADLEAEGRLDASLEGLESIHRRKTGALLRAALKMGGIVAGADADSIQRLEAYGHAVGLAFQIVDDLLDVQGDEAKLGKRVNKDQGLGKWTYPGLLGVEGSRRRARELADEAIEAIEAFGDRGDRLRALALELLERDR